MAWWKPVFNCLILGRCSEQTVAVLPGLSLLPSLQFVVVLLKLNPSNKTNIGPGWWEKILTTCHTSRVSQRVSGIVTSWIEAVLDSSSSTVLFTEKWRSIKFSVNIENNIQRANLIRVSKVFFYLFRVKYFFKVTSQVAKNILQSL